MLQGGGSDWLSRPRIGVAQSARKLKVNEGTVKENPGSLLCTTSLTKRSPWPPNFLWVKDLLNRPEIIQGHDFY